MEEYSLRLLIKAPKFFDSVKKSVHENVEILIEDDKIAEVFFSGERHIEDVEVLDFKSEKDIFVMPGLIDSHLHLAHGGVDAREKADRDPQVALRMYHNGLKNLMAGVTTQRDCGAKNHIDVSYRESLALGLINGPRTLICGQPIIATGGHCTYMGRQIDGKDEASKAVREQLQQRVDFIKLMVTGGISTPTGYPTTPQMTQEEIEACVKIAHNNDKMVAVHAEGGIGIDWCLDAGIDTLEHGIYMTDTQIERIVKLNTWYTPTLYAINAIANEGAVQEVPMTQMMIDKCAAAFEQHAISFKKAYAAGVRMAVGTDYKHGMIGEEMLLMSKCGMPNNEVLQCATLNASKMLRLDNKIGSIEKGKIADIVILKGNPIEDINAGKTISMVIQSGSPVVKNGTLVPNRSYKFYPIQ